MTTLANDSPPNGLSVPIQALWPDARGDWDQAHRAVQNESTKESAWAQADLHRKDGDQSNAACWDARARKRKSGKSFEYEWEQIVEELLAE